MSTIVIDVICPSCGFRFAVDDEAFGLSADCPHCRSDLVVGATSNHPSASDEPLAVSDVEAPPSDLPTDPQSEDAFRDRPLSEMVKAVEQAKATFPQDVVRSVAVLMAGPNRGLPLAIALACLVQTAGIALAMSAWDLFKEVPAGAMTIGLLVAIVPTVWVASAWFRAMEAATAGLDDVSILTFSHGLWEDSIVPAIWLAGSLALSSAPLALGWATMVAVGLPTHPAVLLALAGLGLFLWPGTMLLIAIGDSLMALTPGNLFRLVFGAIGPYLTVWLALVIVGFLGVSVALLAVSVALASGLEKACPLTGLYALLLIGNFTMLLVMRVIGLLYRHYKAHLPFAAE